MVVTLALLVLCCQCLQHVIALKNGLGLVPPMGWNTWCTQGLCGLDRCNDKEVREIADTMTTNGMKELGYEYINMDDCWADKRDDNGNIVADPKRFPDFEATIRYVNEKGFKFGVYTDAGIYTCSTGTRLHRIPGSYGHYEQDAKTYASWNVEYVKMDWCNTKLNGTDLDPHVQYAQMSVALNATGKPIFFNSCEWGKDSPWEWMRTYANSWRSGPDHSDHWASTRDIIEHNIGLGKYAGPGGWNDLDFLMTGGQGCGIFFNEPGKHCPGMTDTEYKTEFIMWCIMASPLLVATDIRNMTDVMKATLLNKELIAVNQDKLGVGGDKVGNWNCSGNASLCQLWAKPLVNGTFAIAVYNKDDNEAHNITFDFGLLPGMTGKKAQVRNLYTHEEYASPMASITAPVEPHGTEVFKLTPITTDNTSA
ncbi:uncharacterized protein LOC135821804 [Sycon ciliatum]|uniref:uncharacterized protein LOC135821804 n=1 Tax=Sycon ciliatum TaxID=27933 RepID=UPI0020AC7C3E|eukprot:scpid76499/ scgid31360/ Alpha-galactosidase; Alpha-D-galactoside galactohydrolase; Melibiase